MKPQNTLNSSLKSSRLSSLQVKIGITIIVLTTLTFAGFGVYQYQAQRSRAQAKLASLANTMAGQMALSVAAPVWNYNMEELARQIEAAMQEKDLLAVVVTDPKAKTLISKTRDAGWHVVDVTQELPAEFPPVAKDLMYEGKSIGSVQVSMTTRFMQAELRQTVMELSMAIIALDLILLGGLLLSLRILLLAPLAQLLRMATAMADGDFQQQIAISQRDEIGVLASAFGEMQTNIAGVVRDVKTAAQDAAQRSREMSVVAEQMSDGAAQQAAATEEVSASMEEMAANIRQTAENAKLTESMAITSADDARAGKQAVTEIIQSMEVIAERISMVQEIAGQTNILSLNATIEAAKAQEYGKGFSVVASSVRELARQSRAAADEIRTLVHSCVVLSAQAGEVLQRLAPNSEKTAELVQEINAAAQEQSHGVEHVNQAVQQLDRVTQHTAATAEQVAATAESLTTQADALQKTMAFFTVNEAPPVAPANETDLLQHLQELEQQLAELRGVARPDAAAAGLSQTRRSSDPPAPAHDGVIHLNAPNAAADERDQEFERY